MIWKSILIAVLAVGALASRERYINEDEVNDLIRQLSHGEEYLRMRQKIQQFQNAGKTTYACLRKQINGDDIQKEVVAANRNGTLNDVIKKYCAKTPEVKTCLHTYASALQSIYNVNTNMLSNATDELLDYVCYNQGERISTFVAEGGPACIEENTSKFSECIQRVGSGPNAIDMSKTITVEQICGVTNVFYSCVEDIFKRCNSTYVRDTVSSVIQLQRKAYPCEP